MSKKPILEKELEKADGITGAQINFLCDRFDVSKLDLADVCDCTLNTFYTYMTKNAEKMPMGSQKSIIEHFLNLFRKERQGYVKKEKQSAGSRILSKEKDAVSEARFKQDLDKVITADKEEEEKEEEATLKKNSSPQPKTAEEPDIYDAEHDSRKENGFYNKEANQESETSPYPHIDQKFEHLSFIAIMFRPKNGNLGEALNEAAEYSSKAGVPVHISNNGKNYKIECVE